MHRRAVAASVLAALSSCAPAASVDAGPSDGGDGPGDAGTAADGGVADEDDGGAAACPALPAAVESGAHGALDPAASPAHARVVLMGGGPEVDRAAARFVEGAQGGDVLVLRASGSTESYTSYFGVELAPDPPAASATTILLEDPVEGDDDGVLCRVAGAEAVWLAGGDQADYLLRWPDALHGALAAAAARTIGGTSAGAMALSGLTFDAREGSVTSTEALAAPAATYVSISPSPFAAASLRGVLVDTHFGARDREGRLLAFLARALVDGLAEAPVVGVGLDEGAALVIEGDAFRVLADDGATVVLYEVRGPADVRAGAGLSLQGARRLVLQDGDEGAWPVDFDAYAPISLVVEDGVVSEAP